MTTVSPAPDIAAGPATARPVAPAPNDIVRERLDEPVVLVPGRIRVLLVAVLIAIAGTVGWLVAGSWPRHLDLPGVLAHGAGPVPVAVQRGGIVTELDVTAGQTVAAGQPLGTVGKEVVRAPARGVVVEVAATPGGVLRTGAPLVTLDRTGDRATGYLLVTDRNDLSRLAVGRRVDFGVPGGAVTGRIGGIEALPADASSLRSRWGVPLAGLPRSGTPVWVLPVRLPTGTRVALGGTDARVTLPALRPYELVFGGGS